MCKSGTEKRTVLDVENVWFVPIRPFLLQKKKDFSLTGRNALCVANALEFVHLKQNFIQVK